MNEKQSLEEVPVNELLQQVLEHGAHELHLQVGFAPRVRRDGEEAAQTLNYNCASAPDVQHLLYDILSDEQIERFENDLALSFEHRIMTAPGIEWRFNGFVVRDRGNIAASFRVVPGAID